MHKAFPDWYRLAAIKPTSEMLEKRWLAVDAMAQWKKASQLQDLVRLIRGTCPPTADIRTALVNVARTHDTTFSARDNEAEVRVLAGATVVAILETPTERADLVGLALLTSTFQGTYGDAIAREFLAYARQYIANEGVRVRASTHRPNVPSSIELKDDDPIGIFRQAIAAAPDFKQLADPTVNLATAAVAAVANVLRAHEKQVYRELDAMREESNMFWWVFSGYSRDLDQPFAALGLAPSCIVAGKELSDLTRLLPGPRAASALLERVLRDIAERPVAKKAKKHTSETASSIQLSDVVNSAPREWRTKWLAQCPPASELTPILTAVQKSLDTDDPKDWISIFIKWTTLSDASHAASLLAMQSYLESILIRAMKTIKV